MLWPNDLAFGKNHFSAIFDLRLRKVKINNLKYSMNVQSFDWFDLIGSIFGQNLVHPLQIWWRLIGNYADETIFKLCLGVNKWTIYQAWKYPPEMAILCPI